MNTQNWPWHARPLRWLCLLLAWVALACETMLPPSPTPVVLPTATPAPSFTPLPLPTATFSPEPEPIRETLTPSPVVSATVTLSPEKRDQYVRIFERVWDIVSENYVYADYNGVDWEASHVTYRSRVEVAPDDAAFWQTMQDLIDMLGDDHSVFLTPEEAAEEDRMLSGNVDYVGIGVFLAVPEGKPYGVVLFSLPGSPAEVVGIKAHDRILAVAGEPACCDPSGFENLDLLRGEAGTTVDIVVQSPDQEPRDVSVQRARIQTRVPVPWRRIATPNGDIGHLSILTLWDETISERTRETLAAQMAAGPLSGLIIDMRVNGGGAYRELYDLLSLFVEGEVGYFFSHGERLDTVRVEANPIRNSQEIPLVILVGRDTASFAEVFSGALQAAGRAMLVGQPTAGNVETLFPYELEDGSRLWLAEETFLPPDGTRWEGQGVQPDAFIEGQWEDFTDETDPYIEAALQMLNGSFTQ